MAHGLDFRQIESFLAVIRHGSFTRAAQELYLTQPAISAQIKQLEQTLGMRLLDRTGKRAVATEAGSVLAQRAERILAQVHQVREDLNDLKGLRRGQLHIGASTTPGVYLLPQVIAQFRKLYPAIQLNLTIDNTLLIEQQIARDELDLGFVGGILTRDEMAIEPFVEDELVAIASPDHPLARERDVCIGTVVREEFVAREAGSATWQCVEAWLKTLRAELNVVLRLDSPEAVKKAVAAGLGISILSRCAVAWEAEAGLLAILKVRGFSLKRQLQIVRHKDRSLSEAAAAFASLARRVSADGRLRRSRPEGAGPRRDGPCRTAAPRSRAHC